MRIVSLRASGGTPIELHPRLTVLLGTTTSDRLALQSVFRAMVGADSSRLEAVMEVNGVGVHLDDAFADTFATRGTADPVLVFGDPPAAQARVGGAATGSPAAPVEQASLDPLRAEQRSLAAEMEVLNRELGMERSAATPASRPPQQASARRRVDAVDGSEAPAWAPLVDSLREALATGRATSGPDAQELADRLERLEAGDVSDRERTAALEQLIAECRLALDALREPPSSPPPFDPERLAAVEQVREEMLTLAAGPARSSRRQRQRLDQLRATEARLLAELGLPTYVSLLSSLAGATAATAEHGERHGRAREAVLIELETFLLERLADSIGGAGRQRLLADAAALLGESADHLEGRSPRLVAGRLRALPRGDLTDAVRVASTLERELRLDTTVARTPQQVLEIAQAHLEVAAEHPWELGGDPDRVERLEQRRRELSARLREVTEVLTARERGASLAVISEPGDPRAASADLREGTPGERGGFFGAGRPSGAAGSVPDLAIGVHDARSVSVVGAMPLLVLESARWTGSEAVAEAPGALPEPLTVAAMSAVTQLVWVTDRREVAAAIEELGALAAVISV